MIIHTPEIQKVLNDTTASDSVKNKHLQTIAKNIGLNAYKCHDDSLGVWVGGTYLNPHKLSLLILGDLPSQRTRRVKKSNRSRCPRS